MERASHEEFSGIIRSFLLSQFGELNDFIEFSSYLKEDLNFDDLALGEFAAASCLRWKYRYQIALLLKFLFHEGLI